MNFPCINIVLLEGEISSWPAFRPENSLKRWFTVVRYMCQKYFLSGKENLGIIFILTNCIWLYQFAACN